MHCFALKTCVSHDIWSHYLWHLGAFLLTAIWMQTTLKKSLPGLTGSLNSHECKYRTEEPGYILQKLTNE